MMYPKCLVCGHKKRDHFESSNYLNAVCFECPPNIIDGDCRHKYVPDNLGYIEKLAKSKGLTD